MNIIVAGIHTGIGKTICSAILCQALQMDYWKPIQAGDLENSDSIFVKNYTKNIFIHTEKFRLTIPASPHYAAEMDGIKISKNDFQIPISQNGIIIETAGGLLSPLAIDFLNIDLIEYLKCPMVLVSQNYLGSINHTLMSIEILKSRKINVLGIIFNGEKNDASESFIQQYSQLPILFSVPKFENVNPKTIQEFVSNNSIKITKS
jgi:dethiobiotin synthetase